MKPKEALSQLKDTGEAWEENLKIEKQFMDDRLFEILKIDEADPAYAIRVAYVKGMAMAIPRLQALRDRLRTKGEENANNETAR